jgi:hypothetical protein
LPIDDTQEQVRGNEMTTNVSSSSSPPHRYTHTHTLPAIVLTPHKPPRAHYAHLATVASCDYEHQPNGWFARHARVEEEVVDMVDGSTMVGTGVDEQQHARAWTKGGHGHGQTTAHACACLPPHPYSQRRLLRLTPLPAMPTSTSSPPLIILIY